MSCPVHGRVPGYIYSHRQEGCTCQRWSLPSIPPGEAEKFKRQQAMIDEILAERRSLRWAERLVRLIRS